MMDTIFSGETLLWAGDFNTGVHHRIIREWVDREGFQISNGPLQPTHGEACLDYVFLKHGEWVPGCFLVGGGDGITHQINPAVLRSPAGGGGRELGGA